MKKQMFAMIGALAVSTGVIGAVEARAVSACLGFPAFGSTVSLFSCSSTTGAVTATGTAEWLIALPADASGSKSVTVTARATAVNAFVRVVSNNSSGTAMASSAFFQIPVSTTYQQLPTLTVPLVAFGVLFVDALMNNGASLNRIDYNQ